MPVTLITGANRGIGFEHARRYIEQGWEVHATARNPDAATELQALAAEHIGRVHIHSLDVTDHASVEALAAQLQGVAIDLLLNNAGTYGPQGFPEGAVYQSLDNMDYTAWRDMLEINLLAPFKVATAFHDHVAASEMKLHVLMSSGLASIADNIGGSYAYRSSKAGLNMLAKGMGEEWDDIITVAMAPGWCNTDLGGPDAPVDTADSVAAQQQLYPTLTSADSGRYLDFNGETVPF